MPLSHEKLTSSCKVKKQIDLQNIFELENSKLKGMKAKVNFFDFHFIHFPELIESLNFFCLELNKIK